MAKAAGPAAWVQCKKCGPRSWTPMASGKLWCHICGLYYDKGDQPQRGASRRKGAGKNAGGGKNAGDGKGGGKNAGGAAGLSKQQLNAIAKR
eukprot:4071596-Pyramimonas_sp.AAC.1